MEKVRLPWRHVAGRSAAGNAASKRPLALSMRLKSTSPGVAPSGEVGGGEVDGSEELGIRPLTAFQQKVQVTISSH